MTPERLKQIRERCEKVPQSGPWEYTEGVVWVPVQCGDQENWEWAKEKVCDTDPLTAPFIAHARQDIPDLLAEREVLVKALREMSKYSDDAGIHAESILREVGEE